MDKDLLTDLKHKAIEVRKEIVRMTYKATSGHPGGSLSSVEMLVYLYFKEMRLDNENPTWEDRDRFVLSKGHAAPALYAVLSMRGFFKKDELRTLRKINSILQGHPDMLLTPGLDMTTGSLGQGLSIANGMALGAKIRHKDFNVFVIVGDGECQEGMVWEAAMAASYHKLDNLYVFLDYNGIQLDGFVKDIMELQPIMDKWKSFGWWVREIDGHNFEEIESTLEDAKQKKASPKMIIAHTIKGKGISFMENDPKWHGKAPNEEQLKSALKELKEDERRLG